MRRFVHEEEFGESLKYNDYSVKLGFGTVRKGRKHVIYSVVS